MLGSFREACALSFFLLQAKAGKKIRSERE
jgi:hypothetical protein